MIVVIDLDAKTSHALPDLPATVDGVAEALKWIKAKREPDQLHVLLTNLHRSNDLFIMGVESPK